MYALYMKLVKKNQKHTTCVKKLVGLGNTGTLTHYAPKSLPEHWSLVLWTFRLSLSPLNLMTWNWCKEKSLRLVWWYGIEFVCMRFLWKGFKRNYHGVIIWSKTLKQKIVLGTPMCATHLSTNYYKWPLLLFCNSRVIQHTNELQNQAIFQLLRSFYA